MVLILCLLVWLFNLNYSRANSRIAFNHSLFFLILYFVIQLIYGYLIDPFNQERLKGEGIEYVLGLAFSWLIVISITLIHALVIFIYIYQKKKTQ